MSRMCICALASAGWTCCAGVIQAASSAMGPTDPLLRKAPAFPRTNGLDRGIQIRRALALETACGASIILQAPYAANGPIRSEEHTSELQSLMRISYAVFCLKKKKNKR